MPNLLLEIGIDEMPVGALSRLAAHLEEQATEELRHGTVACSEMHAYYTPRRLVLLANDLSGVEQGDPIECLTKILLRITADLTPVSAPYWEGAPSGFAVGPVRWLVALYDGELIPISIGNVRSDRITRGHRFHPSAAITLSSVSEYRSALKSASVIVDPEERLKMVKDGMEAAIKESDEPASIDRSPLDEIAAAVEYPQLFTWDLPNDFPDLPHEFAIAALQSKGFVPLRSIDNGGTRFASVADGSVDQESVRSGLKSTVYSLLSHCWFCFTEDRKRPLAEYVHTLRDVPHRDGIGSLWDRMERLRALASEIAPSAKADPSLVDRAAFLCQADLVTDIVLAFPSLQGAAGAIYARFDAEPAAVCQAIEARTLPIASDTQHLSEVSLAVAIADRLDDIVTAIVVGQRANVQDQTWATSRCDALLRLMIDEGIDIDLFALLQRIEERYRTTDGKTKSKEVTSYLHEQLSRFLETEHGIARDVTTAIAPSTRGNVYRTFLCAKALVAAQDKEVFQRLAESIEQLTKSGVSAEGEKFDPALFATEAERTLWREYLKAEGKIDHFIQHREYAQAIDQFTMLQEPIDRYVKSVVTGKPVDERVRTNRLAFAASIIGLFMRVGDLRTLGRAQ